MISYASSLAKVYCLDAGNMHQKMHVPCINEIYLGLENKSDQSWGEPCTCLNHSTTIYNKTSAIQKRNKQLSNYKHINRTLNIFPLPSFMVNVS